MATSLDGFIGRPDGGLDWLTSNESGESGEDYGYQAFLDTVDALVMGRNTFDKVMSFDQWPYSKQVVVLTNRSIELPRDIRDSIEVMSGDPQDIVDRLSEKGFHHLYVEGGRTIQQFLNAGLIQEMTITKLPVIIGEGIPLFASIENDIKLEHLSTSTYGNGFVQSRYKVLHQP